MKNVLTALMIVGAKFKMLVIEANVGSRRFRVLGVRHRQIEQVSGLVLPKGGRGGKGVRCH